MTLRRSLLAASFATALGWLVLGTQADFPPELFGTRSWAGDFLSYYLPNAEYLGLRLSRGELPLWDPRHGAGAPFLASPQVGALYPPNLLHALLPAHTAFTALLALHLALAVAATGAFAASLGSGAFGAVLAGIAYATSLRVLGEAWTPPLFYTSAWMPALFACVERALVRPGSSSVAPLAFSLAFALLAGWPYGVAIAALGAGLYGALRLGGIAWRSRRLPLAEASTLAAGVALGAALAGPQLLPTLELLSQSCRALGSLNEASAIFVDGPHDPRVFGRALLLRGHNDGIPGVLALVLAPLAFLPGPRRGRIAALLSVGLLGLLASFPNDAPVYGWLRALPVLGDFRFPYRYRALPTLALAVAAGVGATRLLALAAARPAVAAATAAALLALQLGTATRPVLGSLVPFPRRAPGVTPIGDAIQGLRDGLDAGGRVLRAGWSGRLRGVDTARVVNDLEPLSLARSAQLLTFFESGRPLVVSRTTGPRAEPFRPEAPQGAPYYGRVGLPETPERAAILDLFSVSRVVSDDPPAWLSQRYERLGGGLSLPSAHRMSHTIVYANPGALPRATRVGGAWPEPYGLQGAVARLVAPDFDPRRGALLDPLPPELEMGQGAVAPYPEGEVRITQDAPEAISLRTRGERPAAIVLSDAWFPGWEARIDGAPVPLLRANLAFRAVAVPAGDHEVALRYRPRTLARGAALAALGLVSLAALAVGTRVSRARSSPGP